MAKKKAHAVEEVNPFAEPEQTSLAESITVRFVGPVRAVLAGRSILHGETRRITRLQWMIAERNRPGEWEEVGKTRGEAESSSPEADEGQG